MDQTTLITRLQKHISGNNTAAEEEELMQWLEGVELKEFNEALKTAIPNEYNKTYAISREFKEKLEQQVDELEAQEQETRETNIPPVHRIHFLRTAWIRYAAAIIILLGIGTYLYINNSKEEPSVTTNPVPVQNDVAPGGNRATLTLADGSKIILDSAANGTIAEQGAMTIEKKGEKIIYSPLTAHRSPLPTAQYNTMSTPRGGQYQLTLPDGSQVWLNAESSITYPTAFARNERKVAVSGEVYFEVKKNTSSPFRIIISQNGLDAGLNPASSRTMESPLQIEVLGTRFNVNTYNEEPTKNITLLEGSVRLTTHNSPLTKNAVHTSLTLKPGQQGQFNPDQQRLSLAANPDVEQVMAWKNGLFNFKRTPLEKVLNQLSRWYDVDIQYANGKIPRKQVSGEMQRSLTLKQVLNILKGLEIKYRIEGKKLVVL